MPGPEIMIHFAQTEHELTEADLDQVTGGEDKKPAASSAMMTLLTNLLQMKHEGLKGIAQNLRG